MFFPISNVPLTLSAAELDYFSLKTREAIHLESRGVTAWTDMDANLLYFPILIDKEVKPLKRNPEVHKLSSLEVNGIHPNT